MVQYLCRTLYECPYCHNRYVNYELARECAEDCVDIEEPEEVEVESHQCEYCLEFFKKECEAVSCEERHIEMQDKCVRAFEERVSRERLRKAAENPYQSRLKV